VRLLHSTSTLSVAAGLFSTTCGACQNDVKLPQMPDARAEGRRAARIVGCGAHLVGRRPGP
jgi:hypothetical protein